MLGTPPYLYRCTASFPPKKKQDIKLELEVDMMRPAIVAGQTVPTKTSNCLLIVPLPGVADL
jgi:hypothetical protein